MTKLLAIAIVCWSIFFYQTAKAHDIEEQQLAEIQEQINDMTLDIITIILQNLPAILASIEEDLLKEKEKHCWHKYPKDPDCIPKMKPMGNE
jgi:ribosomal protein S13